MKPLDRAFVHTARQRPWQFFMADGKTPKVSFGSALVKTVYIARRLQPQIGEQPMIGLLLPPSVGGALTNYALMLTGRVAVNLNYTSSNEVIASCAQQCGIDVVITAKAFLERFPNMVIPGRTLLLEDALGQPRWSEKVIAFALAWLMPAGVLKRALGAHRVKPFAQDGAATEGKASRMDQLATVIFSSGSTGDPKGVMLTHFNVVANISQVSQVFALDASDKDSVSRDGELRQARISAVFSGLPRYPRITFGPFTRSIPEVPGATGWPVSMSTTFTETPGSG